MNTAGPWIVQKSDYADTGYLIKPAGDYVVAITDNNYPTDVEKSNANLIAAAPDMLDAINFMLEVLGPDKHKYDFPTQRAYDRLLQAKEKVLIKD